MNKYDYLKTRAEHLADNVLSLRQVEWQIAFQAYAGYAAIAVAYFALIQGQPMPDRTIGWAAIAAAVLVFFVTLYASLRVQERMHNGRKLQEDALRTMARIARTIYVTPNAARHTNPSKRSFGSEVGRIRGSVLKVNEMPIHGKWYGFASQLTIGVLWVAGIFGFVALKTGLCRLIYG